MPKFHLLLSSRRLQATGRLHGWQQQEPKGLLPRQHCLTSTPAGDPADFGKLNECQKQESGEQQLGECCMRLPKCSHLCKSCHRLAPLPGTYVPYVTNCERPMAASCIPAQSMYEQCDMIRTWAWM